MRLEQLYHITEIARSKSISRAAKKLYISQPALSVSIKSLENELGKVLFKRTNKGLALTSDGEQICHDASSIITILKGWYSNKNENEPSGEVHVVSLPIISSFITQNLLVSFQKEFPKVTVFLHNVRHYDVLERLKTTNASIALTTLSLYSKLLDQIDLLDWESCLLAKDERRIYIGATHPLASKERLTVEDLKQLPLVYHSDTHDQVSKVYEKSFSLCYRVANKEDCLNLVMRNEAAFIQAYAMFKNDWRYTHKLVVDKIIPLPEIDAQTDVYAFHSPNISETERLFWNYLITYFPRYL